MEFRFDANQEFQIQAVQAVTGLFDAQAKVEGQLQFQNGTPALRRGSLLLRRGKGKGSGTFSVPRQEAS